MRLGAVAICIAGLSAATANAEGIASAEYDAPTTRYAHGILGDAVEWGALVMRTETGRTVRLILPENRVFEDTKPRLFDVDGDGDSEVITVETDIDRGARLAIYDDTGLVSSNDFIGQTNRWIAPSGVGAADLDGDGTVELVFVDRPHLAKVLRIYEFAPGKLKLEASFQGVTNHRIGEKDIAGGIRLCREVPEIVLADTGWSEIVALRWDGARFDLDRLGPHEGRETFAQAMDCTL